MLFDSPTARDVQTQFHTKITKRSAHDGDTKIPDLCAIRPVRRDDGTLRIAAKSVDFVAEDVTV